MKSDRNVNIANKVTLQDKGGNPVGFQGTNHYDASSLFSDTVDLPTPGYLYIKDAGDINVLLINSVTPLVYTFESSGLYPLIVKRIYTTSTTVNNAYIIM